jgi:hypothetical protein
LIAQMPNGNPISQPIDHVIVACVAAVPAHG